MAPDLSRARLLYRSGPARDFALPEAEAIVGYGGGAAVRVPMEGVSRKHAKISFDGKDFWIEDAGSSNGTFLNGVRLTRRERLRHLDVVALGRYTELIFVRKTGEAPTTTRNGIKVAYLEILDGTDAGNRFALPRGSVTIGRAPSNNVVSDSQLISKIHARLECTGLQLVLTDLHSQNGTFVDGEKIVEARILKDGDEFILGGARRFRVRLEEGSIETSGVALLPAPTQSDPSLPMDWKTRLEWTPEELASFQHAVRVARPGETARSEAAKPREAPPAKPAPPAAAAPKKVVHPPAKPADRAPAEAKPAAPAPKPVAHPEPKPAAPAQPAVEKPADTAQPPAPPARPAAAAPLKPSPPTPPATRPMDAAAKPAAAAPLKSGPPPAAARAAASASEKSQVPAAPVSPPAAKAAPPAQQMESAPASEPPSAPSTPRTTDVGEATQALPPDEASKPRVYLEGNLEGKDLLFALPFGEHVVGRVPEVDVHLAGSEVSRRHAIIRVGLSEVTVEDLQSRNGTFVNRERLTAPRRLQNNDVVHFGDVPLRVRFPGTGSAERSPVQPENVT